MNGRAYAIKRADKFLRFGSYRSATEGTNPLGGTLYATRRGAEARLNPPRYFWIGGHKVDSRTLRIVEIEGREAR